MNYKKSHFLRLQDYIADGSKGELTPEEQDYEDLLYTTAHLMRREGRQAALDWLQADRCVSRHVALRVVGEAMNLFYGDDTITRTAWRNLLMQKTMDAARRFEKQYFDRDESADETDCIPKAKDFEAYVKLLALAAKLQRVEQPDEPVRDTKNFIKEVTVITTDARQVGIPDTDRRRILANPYFQQLPKRHQHRLEMEIGTAPMDIDTILDNSEELAKEVEE